MKSLTVQKFKWRLKLLTDMTGYIMYAPDHSIKGNKKGARLLQELMRITADWTEARTIQYTNFPVKYMNSCSKLHWNIHVVPIRSVSRETITGVLVFRSCTIMWNVIAHSILVQSELFQFWLLSFMTCFGIFSINVIFAVYWLSNTTTELALITKL